MLMMLAVVLMVIIGVADDAGDVDAATGDMLML